MITVTLDVITHGSAARYSPGHPPARAKQRHRTLQLAAGLGRFWQIYTRPCSRCTSWPWAHFLCSFPQAPHLSPPPSDAAFLYLLLITPRLRPLRQACWCPDTGFLISLAPSHCRHQVAHLFEPSWGLTAEPPPPAALRERRV